MQDLKVVDPPKPPSGPQYLLCSMSQYISPTCDKLVEYFVDTIKILDDAGEKVDRLILKPANNKDNTVGHICSKCQTIVCHECSKLSESSVCLGCIHKEPGMKPLKPKVYCTDHSMSVDGPKKADKWIKIKYACFFISALIVSYFIQ